MRSITYGTRKQLTDLLSSIPLFTSLKALQIEELLNSGRLERYSLGQNVVQQGDMAQDLFIVLEGKIKVFYRSDEGEEDVIKLLRSGDIYMEPFIFSKESVPLSAKATSKTLLFMVSLDDIRKFARKDFAFSQVLFESLSQKYKEAVLRSTSIRLKKPVQLLGCYLLHLLIESNKTDSTFTLPHKKLLIASQLGMKPETLSRAIVELKNMGIFVEGNRVFVPNIHSLCQFCDKEATVNCQNIGVLNRQHCKRSLN